MTGQERTDELVACAEEEGQLNVYTSNTDMEDLIDVFSDQYDIEVNNYRAGSESVLQRILQEDEASYYGADIFETNALELGVADQEGLLYPYKGELRDSVLEQGRQAEGWTATRFNAFVVGWNTDKVKAGEEPKTLEELAEPAVEGPDLDGGRRRRLVHRAARLLRRGAGLERGGVHRLHDPPGLELAGRQGPHGPGRAALGRPVRRRRLARTATRSTRPPTRAALPSPGSPPSGEPVQPIISRPNGIGLVKTATNPCAALLFVDFELTGGQDVFKEAFRVGSVEGGDNPLSAYETYPVPEEKLLDDPGHLGQGLRGRRRQRPGHRLSRRRTARTSL